MYMSCMDTLHLFCADRLDKTCHDYQASEDGSKDLENPDGSLEYLHLGLAVKLAQVTDPRHEPQQGDAIHNFVEGASYKSRF